MLMCTPENVDDDCVGDISEFSFKFKMIKSISF